MSTSSCLSQYNPVLLYTYNTAKAQYCLGSWERESLWLCEAERDVDPYQHGGYAGEHTQQTLRTLPQEQTPGDGILWKRVQEVSNNP